MHSTTTPPQKVTEHLTSHIFGEVHPKPHLTPPGDERTPLPERSSARRASAAAVASAPVPGRAPGGPLGISWATDGRPDREAAPRGSYWLTIEQQREGWRWAVTDSWMRAVVARGAAGTRTAARVRAELAVWLRELQTASSVTVRAAIAFGDWPADEAVH